MWKVLFVVLLAFVTVPAAVIFEDCGSAYQLRMVSIEGCGWTLPCYVTLGEETSVKLEFFADFASNLLDQNVVINVNLVNVNADVTPDNCLTDDCPVNTGAINSFISVMSVPSIMALNQRGYLNWRIYNEQKRLVICYSVLVQTQSTLQKRLRQLLLEITPEHANDIVDNMDLSAFDASLTMDPELSDDEPIRDYLQELIDQYYQHSQRLRAAPTKEMNYGQKNNGIIIYSFFYG